MLYKNKQQLIFLVCTTECNVAKSMFSVLHNPWCIFALISKFWIDHGFVNWPFVCVCARVCACACARAPAPAPVRVCLKEVSSAHQGCLFDQKCSKKRKKLNIITISNSCCLYYILNNLYNLFLWCKAEYQQPLLQNVTSLEIIQFHDTFFRIIWWIESSK